MPRVLPVIEVEETIGKGLPHDPVRTILRYYTPEGRLLAEGPDLLSTGPRFTISEVMAAALPEHRASLGAALKACGWAWVE